MSLFKKISDGLKKTRSSMGSAINGVLSRFRRVDEELFDELEEALVSCDVGAETAMALCDDLREKVKLEKIDDPGEIREILRKNIAEMLEGDNTLDLAGKPSVILMIGVNGAGKTTSVGKLAAMLKAEGKNVLVAAADTFRAAAIEQLEVWTQKAGVGIIKSREGYDPASVVFDAVSAAKARGTDVVICDTAGRLHNKKNLMDELAKIRRVVARETDDKSVETLLVLDATTGQNAVNQAREFREAADITGIILTKLDGTARGGVVLSIRKELGIPVKFVGVGEQIDDLQPFDPYQFADALF